MKNGETTYIVAGDEMLKLMREKFPDRQAVPFREDLSRGSFSGHSFDADLIARRASFWNVSKEESTEKMAPVIGLDPEKNYTLCFGRDACCTANLAFMTGLLREKGYRMPVHVMIVDENDLTVLEEYDKY